MEERSRRNQFRPFRFWMPSWTSPIGRTCSPIPTGQRLNPPSSSQPSAQAKPMPTSASRRPNTARKGSQQPCLNVPHDHHSAQPHPRDQNGRPPVQSRTKIKSPSTMREASKAPVQIHPGSDKQPREAQVKFLSNSQSQLPETKNYPANQPISQAHEAQSITSPSSTITLQHKLQAQTPIRRHVTINAMEKTSGESYSNTSSLPFISTKATEQINLEKPQPSQPHNVEDTPINIKTEVASASSDVNIEQRRSSNEKERKIAIYPVSKDSFTDGKRAIYKEEIKEGLSTLKQTISAADSGRGRNNDSSVNVITLAGKNNGASMVIGYDDTNTESLFQPCKDSVVASSINNNVQSINNSAIEQSSCSVRHPGVHLKFSNRSSETLAMKPQNTERRTFAPLRGQMTSQEPRIRRRCLRALFMESSESDIESSRKPPRHGCRFSCEEKRKTKNDDRQMSTTKTGAQANG